MHGDVPLLHCWSSKSSFARVFKLLLANEAGGNETPSAPRNEVGEESLVPWNEAEDLDAWTFGLRGP
jgi:hypothetical protein